VVFFERIKDEVHEGRSVRVAIPRAWIRARRTILSADTVSFLAAAILYYFAAGDVKGFAFTLGLSTILDVIVVFLFTHPLISLLSRMRAFGTGRLTGLAHIRDGVVVTAPAPARPAGRRAEPRREAAPDDAQQVQLSKSAVATLDEPTEAPESDDITDHITGEVEDSSNEPETQRRHTTPAPGSAAERAAARRARLREKGER
jgi:preprotein translocase subunit SecD